MKNYYMPSKCKAKESHRHWRFSCFPCFQVMVPKFSNLKFDFLWPQWTTDPLPTPFQNTVVIFFLLIVIFDAKELEFLPKTPCHNCQNFVILDFDLFDHCASLKILTLPFSCQGAEIFKTRISNWILTFFYLCAISKF